MRVVKRLTKHIPIPVIMMLASLLLVFYLLYLDDVTLPHQDVINGKNLNQSKHAQQTVYHVRTSRDDQLLQKFQSWNSMKNIVDLENLNNKVSEKFDRTLKSPKIQDSARKSQNEIQQRENESLPLRRKYVVYSCK